jgi:hypothetical protein
MIENRVNLKNKNIKFLDTDNPNIKLVLPDIGTRFIEDDLSIEETVLPSERIIEKPEPKYSKKEILNVGDKKQIPNNWRRISDESRFVEDGSYVMPLSSVAPPPPAAEPGPCCMGDTYIHKLTTSFNAPYVWNALAGGPSSSLVVGEVPQGVLSPTYGKYNIIPTNPDGEFINGHWNYNVESAQLAPGLTNVESNVWGAASAQFENQSLMFSSFGSYSWDGSVTTNTKKIENWGQRWAFQPKIYKILSHDGQAQGMQTQIDWSNSTSRYPGTHVSSTGAWNSYFQFEYISPELQIDEEGAVSSWIDGGIKNPFCQGRALLNAGQAEKPNPWPGKSYASGVGSNPDGKLNNPRRMGWEGWILRPTNVDWNWGNRGAFEDILHYTLGPAEQGSPSTANPYVDTYGYPHQWGNVLDSKSCSDGYCDYPMPSPITISNLSYPGSPAVWIKPPPSMFYGGPHIGYSQLYHQRICCSNSQWFQNARVLRNYSEEVWNIIGSPFAGGSPTITLNQNQLSQTTFSLSNLGEDLGLVGTNGNGPATNNTDAFQSKFSCTTYSTLNRILQYISSPSDFEEVYARDYGNYRNGLPKPGTVISRLWFPAQAGYYNPDAGVSEDDPWENMYRYSDVGTFYTRINLCGQAANESLSLGELGNLGNPPIAQYDTVYGTSASKLNPGIWPWGHCISYACGNPEYSPNYDSGTASSGAKSAAPRENLSTFNKLGERGCEAQTPWAQMPLNYYYSNVTFAGIKIHFYDESTGEMTSKMFRKWSFSNSNEWVGTVPPTYEEASESAIGFMMWLGHNSWDYNMTNPTAYPDSTQAGLYGPSVGRPAGSSGGTGVEYWEPVNTDMFNTPYTEGHFVNSLSNTTLRASTNGYYKGIRPNYTFLDVATHLLKMEEEWPLKHSNPEFDYNNRPTGVPEYIAGVAVAGTYKTNNPQTGIPAYWWNQSPVGLTTLPDGSPYYWENQFLGGGNPCCNRFPGESNTNPHRQNTSYPGQPNTNTPPLSDPSWAGLKDGPGNPGGGNYCRQSYMVNSITLVPNVALQALNTPPYSCGNWSDLPNFYVTNNYIPGCFKSGLVGTNMINSSNAIFHNNCFASGDVRGVFQDRTINCVCPPWYSKKPIKEFIPQLLTGPHCEGCNVGCCTNEFNSVNRCEYVYPQGLFKSKWDCMRAHRYESETIPSSVPSLFVQQNATTPPGRRKTYTSPLGDTTFCKLRPQGNKGCLSSLALNYSPAHTEDCSGSIAWTYRNPWTSSVGLAISVDNSCCEYNKPGYRCDTSSDVDGDGMGDCLQTCTYGATSTTISLGVFGSFTFWFPGTMEPEGCYSAKTECDSVGCPYYATSMPGYSCDYPNSNIGCAQNTIFSLVSPPTLAQLQTGGPYSSLTQCELYYGGAGSPYCTPQSGWQCRGNGNLQPGLSIMPFYPWEKTDGTANGNNPNNFFEDACQYTSNYYGPPANGIVQSDNWWTISNIPAGRLYDSKEDCLADCFPCVDPNMVWNPNITQNVAQEWCQRIKDELQNQFGNFWTENDLSSAQFNDPNPTNLPPTYSPNFDSSWRSKYKNCCMGRICTSLKFGDAEEYALKSGTQTNHHGICGTWDYPNLGFSFPAYGDFIQWNYDNPGFWCNLASNQDQQANYAGSQSQGGASYEFVPGQGYQPKTTWPIGAGNNGPDGVCEDEAIKGVGGAWNDWDSGVGFKT